MRVGILLGDDEVLGSPGVIHGVIMKALDDGDEVRGILRGWKGVLNGEILVWDRTNIGNWPMKQELDLHATRVNPFSLHDESKKNPEKHDQGPGKQIQAELVTNLGELGINALVVVGGQETLSMAARLGEECNTKIIGVPVSIENDLQGTDYSLGFWSSVQQASTLLQNLTVTATSSQQVMVAEIPGENAGWLTLMSGIVSGVDIMLVPELPFDLQEDVMEVLVKRVQEGCSHLVVAVAEGAIPTAQSLERDFKIIPKNLLKRLHQSEHADNGPPSPNVSKILATAIAANAPLLVECNKHGVELNVVDVDLGHLIGAAPLTAFDWTLGLRFGARALELLHEGKSGFMVCLRGAMIDTCKIADGAKRPTVQRGEMSDLFEVRRLLAGIQPKGGARRGNLHQ